MSIQSILKAFISPLAIMFLVNLVINIVLVVLGRSWGYSGALTLDGVGGAVGGLFGSIPALLVMLSVPILLALLYVIFVVLSKTQHHHGVAIFGLITVLITAAVASVGFIRFIIVPGVDVWPFLILVLLAVVQTAVAWALFSSRFRVVAQAWRMRRATKQRTRATSSVPDINSEDWLNAQLERVRAQKAATDPDATPVVPN